MTQRNFAGPRDRAPADQAGVTDGVMRRAKRPGAHQAARLLEHSGNAMNARGLDGFLERHRRQNCRNALGQHGFSRAGRAEENNIVAACAGDFERALGTLLAANIAEVHRILRGLREQALRIQAQRRRGLRGVHQIDSLRQRFDGVDVDAVDHGGFRGIRRRNHQRADAPLAHAERGGKGPADGPHAAVERKLAQKGVIGERLAEKSSLASEDAERHRKIEGRAFLANVGRRQIDGNALRRGEIEAAIFERGLDALAALFNGDVGQSDHVKITHAAGTDIHFDLDLVGVDAKHCGA
jgi:hypothetical protein